MNVALSLVLPVWVSMNGTNTSSALTMFSTKAGDKPLNVFEDHEE
jgi:hypothetical protein